MIAEYEFKAQPVQAASIDEYIMVVDRHKQALVMIKDRRKRPRYTTAQRLLRITL